MIAEAGRDHQTAHGCLPTERQCLLLTACTAPAESAAKAWMTWRCRGDLGSVDPASERLLLWIFHRRDELGLSVEDRDALEVSCRRVWVRNQVLLNRCATLIAALEARGIEPILLKGISLLSELYGDEGGRYLEDFDLLVRPDQLEAAVKTLESVGWNLPRGESLRPETKHSQGFLNAEGLSCDLHWNLFRLYYGVPMDESIWSVCRKIAFRGATAAVLSVEHQLLHLCVHSMAWEPVAPIRWVLDIHLLLKRHPVRWDFIEREALRWKLTLPLFEALSVLQQIVPGSVPGDLLARLECVPVSADQKRLYSHRVTMPSPVGVLRGVFQDWNEARIDGKRPGLTTFLRQRWKVHSFWAIPRQAFLRFRRRWMSLRIGRRS
jgi:hypothetical protein